MNVASDKNFYANLNTKVISDAPSSDIQLLSNPINLESANKGVLDAVIQVNAATMRDGRHIPGTSEIATAATTESGTRVVVKTPAKGEVWEIDTAGISSLTGGSGNAVCSFFITEGSEIMLVGSLTTDTFPAVIGASMRGLQIDENNTLQVSVTRSSLSDGNAQVLLYKVR